MLSSENRVNSGTSGSGKKYTSLGYSLVLWFLLISLVPLSAVSWMGYQKTTESLTKAAVEKLTQSALLNQKFIQVWFQYRLMDINFQAENANNKKKLVSLTQAWVESGKPLKNYVNSNDWGKIAQIAGNDLVHMQQRYDYIYDIFLIDFNGNILYSVAHESDLGTNLFAGPYANTRFAQTVRETIRSGNTMVSDIERYAPSNNAVASFINAPIRDDTGKILGVIAIQIKADRIVEVLRQEKSEEGSLVHYIVGEDARLRTTMSRSGNDYSDVLLTEIHTEQFATWLVERSDPEHIAAEHEEEAAFIYAGPNGQPVIGIHNDLHVPGINWVLISEIDESDALASAHWFAKLTLMVLTLTIVIVVIVAVFQARRITRPIVKLMRASRRVASGEMEHQVDVVSNNEIGKLAEAFNHMITMRQIHTRALEETNSRTKAALAALDEQRFAIDQHSIVAVTDVRGNITYVNEKFTQISGYAKSELLGKNHRILNSGYHDKAFFADMYKTISSGKVWHNEVCNRAKDGSLYWVDTTIAPFMGEDNKPKSYIAIRTDITRQKSIESQLTEALEEAQVASRLKSDFLANMSHEIRTPMNGVIGMTGLLLDTDLTAKQRDYAENTLKSADALLTIINDILDFSKIEAGKLELEIVPLDLRELMEDVAELMALKCREKNIEMLLRYKPECRRYFLGDPGRIRQILLNLLSNAVKFTEQGHVLLSVESYDGVDDTNTLLIKVKDTGIGIEQSKLDKIFNKFDQEDSSTTRKFGGTGLGLAICRELCYLMQGNIIVHSEKGKGSVFSFTLTLATDPSLDSDVNQTPDQYGKRQDNRELKYAETHCLSGRKILLIDALPISRTILLEQISGTNITVETAESASLALEKITNAASRLSPFDIVIIDSHSVEMTDGNFLEKIEKYHLFDNGVLVYMTSVPSKGDSERLRELGFDAYLTKPTRASELPQILSLAWQEKIQNNKRDCFITRHTLRSKEKGSQKQVSFADVHVLLVEDNPVNQMVATEYLEGYGCTITPAGNGIEVLEQIETQDFDLIFMDCQMPEMDGFEATREIRQRNIKSRGADKMRVPIVAFTANAMQGDREKCLVAGMDDFISKPVNQKALEEILKKWLSHKIASLSVENSENLDAEENANKINENDDLNLTVFNGLKKLFKDGFPDVVKKHTDSAVENIKLIEMAIENVDYKTLERAAHSIKGASSQFGAGRLSEIASQVESLAKAENGQDMEKIKTCFLLLKREQKVVEAIMLQQVA